jgi:hypothetical protein
MKEVKEITENKDLEVLTNSIPSVTSVLPTSQLEYTDGTNWFQLATQNYVNVVAKVACTVATVGTNLTATYANGTAGVGATLTNSGTQVIFTLDGISPSLNQRVLVKDQTSTFQNGIYTVTNVGSASINWVLTRATDYDSVYLINPGDDITIVSGTVNASSAFMQTAVITTIGTSAITFSSLSKIGVLTISGTTNQIVISGTATNPIIGIVSNPVIPGTAGMTLPGGSTAQRPGSPVAGTLRYWNGL